MSTDQSKAMMLVQPRGDLPTPNDFATMRSLAEMFAASGMYTNAKTPAHALAIVQTGRELGIGPAAALRSITIINNKPSLSAEALAALIQRDHGDDALRVMEYSEERCTVQAKRRGWASPVTVTFSMDDAKKAGLLRNDTWQKYPRAMLRSRAISEAAKTAFQDSVLGLYTSEELAPDLVEVDASGDIVVKDVTPQTREINGRQVDTRTGQVLDAEIVDDGPTYSTQVNPERPTPTGPTMDAQTAIQKALNLARDKKGYPIPDKPNGAAINALAVWAGIQPRTPEQGQITWAMALYEAIDAHDPYADPFGEPTHAPEVLPDFSVAGAESSAPASSPRVKNILTMIRNARTTDDLTVVMDLVSDFYDKEAIPESDFITLSAVVTLAGDMLAAPSFGSLTDAIGAASSHIAEWPREYVDTLVALGSRLLPQTVQVQA